MRLSFFVLTFVFFPVVAAAQTAKNNSQAVETGNESNVNLGELQIIAGRDVTLQYEQPEYRRDLERQIARLEVELAKEKASSGAAQDDILQKRRELDGARSKLADIEASYEEKLDELQTLQDLLTSLGPEADRARVARAKGALQNGDTSAAVALANELRDDKAGDVDAAASAEFILGAAHETELRWFKADAHYRRAAELDPDANRLAKACELAELVDDLPRARRHCADRVEQLQNIGRNAGPDMAKALSDLAEIEGQLGDISGAQDHFGTALVVGKSLAEEMDRLIYAESLARYSEFLAPLGKIRKAEESAQEALKITEEILGPEHRDVAERLWILGSIYLSVLDVQKASEILGQSLELTSATLGQTHPDYASRLLDYADASYAAGSIKPSTATAMSTEALSLIKQTLGPDHYEYGRALQHFAGYLWVNGETKIALETAEKALDIIQASRGDASDAAIYAMLSVAAFATGAGDYEYAKKISLRAREAAIETYGAESFIVGKAHDRLGSIYFQLKDYERAETEQRKARSVFRATLGENSVEFASASSGLSVVLRDTGRQKEALVLARSSYDTHQRILGDASFLTAVNALTLGTIYSGLGDDDNALMLIETARTTIENAWGREHTIWAAATQGLGVLQINRGEYAAGIESFSAALEIFEAQAATSNPIFTTRFNLVLALAFDRRAKEAIQEAEALKTYVNAEYAAAHAHNGLAHRAAGMAYKEAGKLEQAEKEFRTAIAILEDLGDADATHRVMSMVSLSQVLSDLRRTQDAAHTMLQAADAAEKMFGPEHRWSFGLRRQAAQGLVSIERYDEAERITSDLLIRTKEHLGRLSDERWQVVSLRAWLERARGATTETIPIHEERLALAIEKFGETSEQRIVSLKLLADVHKDIGNLDVAGQNAALALDLAKAHMPADHAEVADLIDMQRFLARDAGNFREAADYARRAVDFARENVNERSDELVDALNGYGDSLSEIDANQAARVAFEEASELAEDLDKDGRYKVAAAITDLGHLAMKLGDLRHAESYFEDALDIVEDLGGKEHDAYPIALRNLATAKLQMNDIEEARQMHAEIIEVTAKRHGEESLQYAQVLLSRGTVSLRANDLTAAESDINRALDFLSDVKAPLDDIEDAQAIKADLLIAKGRTDEAVAILKEHAAEVEETDADLRFNSYAARDRLAWLLFENRDVERAGDLVTEQLASLESVGLIKGWYFLSAQALQIMVAVLQGDQQAAEGLLDAVTALAEQRHEVESTQHMLADEARMYVTYAFGDKARASIDRALLEDRANRLLGAINPERKRLQNRIDFILAEAANLAKTSAEDAQ